ncbi:MAG: Invasion associated locus B family protein [Candidatus Tokpelaia sp. JSC161]|nr:MAG: Invasion associated locus B family protein [Candidatus Tokpelaia sp. JSC161]
MSGKISITVLITLTLLATSALGQTPQKINQFDYWGAYSYKNHKNTLCYILSTPTEQQPSTVKHGDNFFLLSKKIAAKKITFEPQFMAGYTLKKNSRVNLSIGNKNFSMFTKNTSAWIDTNKGELNLVAAMKKGKSLTVQAISERGTNTTYTYSLKGITAAIDAIQKCK